MNGMKTYKRQRKWVHHYNRQPIHTFEFDRPTTPEHTSTDSGLSLREPLDSNSRKGADTEGTKGAIASPTTFCNIPRVYSRHYTLESILLFTR